MTNENSQNSQQNLYCKLCDYYSFRKSDYKKHLLTDKHIKLQNNYVILAENSQKTLIKCYNCNECDKTFKHQSSLWNHKKIDRKTKT